MNRLHYCLVSLFAVVTLFACSNDPEVTPPTIPLGSTDVKIWAGKDTSISINDTAVSAITLNSSNTDVATIKLEGRKIQIHAVKEGVTTVLLNAPGNRQGALTVRIIGIGGGTGWRRVDRNDKFPLVISVQAADAAFAEKLKTQLTDEILGKVTDGPAALIFTGTDSGTFVEGRGSKMIREGNYTFRNLTLTLNPGATQELYTLVPQNLTTFKMVRDRTEEFKAANPDKGIELVKVETYWGKINTPG